MMCLVERKPPRQRAPAPTGVILLDGEAERTRDLVTGGLLLTRDLGMRGAAAHPCAQAPAEPFAHALASAELGMRLGERAAAARAGVAPLAPPQDRRTPADRQIADRDDPAVP